MKVFINGRFLTQRTTGVQRYALETLLALDEELASIPRDDIDVVLLAPEGCRPPPLRRIGFSVVGPLHGNLWEQLALPLAAREGLLISFCTTGPLFKRDQVITIHDASIFAAATSFSWRFRLWYRALLAVLVRRVRKVLTVSRFSRREIVRYYGCDDDKLRVSGAGWQHILRTESDAGVLAKHGLKSQRYFLTVGSVTPHKNLAVVGDALERLGDLDHPIVVAGGFNQRVFRPAELSPRSYKALGYVSDAELRALYEHATAFVFPSRYEGFGIPPLEAMALGCPVIASNAASIPEVCGDAALYFSPDDCEGLVQRIRSVASNPAQRQALIAKGRARAACHSWRHAARVHLSVIDECRRARADRAPRSVEACGRR